MLKLIRQRGEGMRLRSLSPTTKEDAFDVLFQRPKAAKGGRKGRGSPGGGGGGDYFKIPRGGDSAFPSIHAVEKERKSWEEKGEEVFICACFAKWGSRKGGQQSLDRRRVGGKKTKKGS